MKYSKFAYTLAEMLICLAIISVVVAMVIPAAMSKKPAKNKALFRKSYYNLERAVHEMVNDESLFPDTKASDYASTALDHSTLFAYYYPDAVIDAANDEQKKSMKVKIQSSGPYYSMTRYRVRKGKYSSSWGTTGELFCSEFAKRMNISGKASCNCQVTMPDDGTLPKPKANCLKGAPSFVTNDGVMWYINPLGDFCVRREKPDGTIEYRSGDTASTCKHEVSANGDLKPATSTNYLSDYVCFQLDVNGEAAPNSRFGHDPDRFQICVYYDGRIEIPRYQNPANKTDKSKESLYLESNKIVD